MSVCLLSELNLDLDEVMLLLLLILRVWSQVEKQPPKTSSHHRLKILSRHVTAATPSTAIADTSTSTSTSTITLLGSLLAIFLGSSLESSDHFAINNSDDIYFTVFTD
ncbi:hypothetical protein YC2023_037926 [Brassica napus]